jgi:hypothetical protein
MNTRYPIVILIMLVAIMTISQPAWSAVHVFLFGSWTETIDETDLQGGAGSDLNSTYDHTIAVYIWIFRGSNNWRLDVRKNDTNWHSNLHLWISSDGTNYQEVTGTYQQFMTGSGSGLQPVYLRVTGVSVQVPADTYATTVSYHAVQL